VNKSPTVALEASKPDTTSAPEMERWLFVDGATAFGGHEVMLLRWLEELATQRVVSPFVLARRGSQLKREAVRHAVIVELPAQGTGIVARLIGGVRDAFAFARAAFTLRPRVCVIAEGCLLSQPLFAFLGRLLGLRVLIYVPLVQTSVSMGFGSGRTRDAFVRRIYSKLPHAWITITREQAEDFRRWAGVRQPVLTLPNTVARAIEANRVDGSTHREGDMPFRIVVLGRIEAHQKGLDLLLDYISAHPELGGALQLSFVGTGPYEQTIRARLQDDAALARWVKLRPWSPTDEALAKADVLLMTSRYEGVPLVMLEAMALGIPVVAPDLEGTRAFLDARALFPRGDMQAAFDIIGQLIDPTARAAVVARNRETFQATASNASFAQAVKALTPQIRALGLGARQRSA